MTLPTGTLVRYNRHTRTYQDGRILVGGSPTRLLYLTQTAQDLIRPRGLTVSAGPAAVLANRLLETGMADPDLDTLPAISLTKLSVVIPVRDRSEALDRLVAHLRFVEDVIVVDDASASPAVIAEVCARHGATLVRMPVNRGPAAARNAGLALVDTPFLAFLDSDVVPEPGAIERLLRHFHDPQVALVAPRIRGLCATGKTTWIGRYENARSSLDLGPHPGTVRPRSPISWVPGACMVARVSALGDGFSDEMRVGEDVDLVWRLVAARWQIRYEPTAIVRHEHRATLVAWLGRKALYGTSAHELAQRHGPAVAPAAVAPWSAAFVIALLAQRRWSVPVALATYGLATVRMASKLNRGTNPLSLAARLSTNGASASITQAAALLLRHWWPLTAVAALHTSAIRRAAATVGLVDGILEWHRTQADLDPVRFLLARRLDDLAYGAGVWFASLRGKSIKALLPDIVHST